MRTIVTGHVPGFLILVDDEDYRPLNKHVWNALGSPKRYAYTQIDGVRTPMHRLLLPGRHYAVDHINGDTLDNRKCNLRPASRSLNALNCNTPPRSNTGIRGVHMNVRGRYVARVQGVYLGQFLTIQEAESAAGAARAAAVENSK